MNRFYGIDFSGSATQWAPSRRSSNVWIADIFEKQDKKPCLASLRRVQQLPGDTRPFQRLVTLLGTGDYCAAGIDAPFSIPLNRVPQNSYANVLAKVDQTPVPRNRDFIDGPTFVELFVDLPEHNYRQTEKIWRSGGLPVRSTMWHCVKPCARGGAEMTSACVKILAQINSLTGMKCPIWPWTNSQASGVLVEAFPMAQLKEWQLPHQQYNGDDGGQQRHAIVKAVRTRLEVGDSELAVMLANADALDAVLCGFAAIAAQRDALAVVPDPNFAGSEGWIAVHK